MIRKTAAIIKFWFCLLIPFSVFGADVDVGELKLSSNQWGSQTANFSIVNNSEDYKFVIATSEVRFMGRAYQPTRHAKESYFLQPADTVNAALPVIIPPGYGNAAIDIKLYDVIDTLDQLVESQKFYSKSIIVKYPIPEELRKEVGLDIALPKFVEDNAYFDNHFARVLMVLLGRGKTIDEIGKICRVSPEYINSAISIFQDEGYLVKDGSNFSPTFMIIDKDRADKIRPLVDATVDSLYKLLSANLKGYDSCVSAMISEGRLSTDKFDALDGGTILYHKYPVMMALFLWNILGREFVNGGKPFNIFQDSDPCNAFMGDMMYMADNAGKNIGETYYYYVPEMANGMIYCGIGKHNIVCQPGYHELAKRNLRVGWSLDQNIPDMIFLYNEEKVRVPLSILMDGTVEYVDRLGAETDRVFAGPKYDNYKRGAKYWCWDLVVTLLMNKFESSGLLEKEGDGIYRFQSADF